MDTLGGNIVSGGGGGGRTSGINPLLLFCGIFVLNQFLQYVDVKNTFTACYLDDLLFFPVVLSINAFFQKKMWSEYRIPWSHVLGGLIVVSVLFEWVIPWYDSRFTADVWDIGFYILGIFWYYISLNLERKAKVLWKAGAA